MAERKVRELPNLDNMSTDGLIENIYAERETQKEGKFREGVFRQKLDTMWPEGQTSIESEKLVATLVPGQQERLDTDKIREDVSRDELLAKGWLKSIPTNTLKIAPKS